MSARREYRVSWLRKGNASPRSKRFPTKARAEAYLAALRARTPEERYGDKVDKYVCCSGWDCGCKGETWRGRWEEKFGELIRNGDIAPLEWSKIDSRPLAKWEPEEVGWAALRPGDVFRYKGNIKGLEDFRQMAVTAVPDKAGCITTVTLVGNEAIGISTGRVNRTHIRGAAIEVLTHD